MATTQRWRIRLVTGAAFALAVIYSVVTPLFEASDELWHYPFVKRLADGLGLVVYDDPSHPAPWRQEAYQPPLYYALGAAATFWIDTGDLAHVRTLNPHADIGVPQPDGNINMVVHDPAAEAFPWRGTALAMHIVRLLSALMTAGTVYFTYRLALEVFPANEALALTAAAITGFTPMFLFIGGSVNNDNAVVFFCTVGLWLVARMIRRPPEIVPGTVEWALLGLVAGLAMLSKTSGLALLGMAGLATLYRAWVSRRHASPLLAFRGGLVTLGVSLLVAGWWYVRNTVLYGDPTALAYFLNFVGRRVPEPTLLELWGERWGFMAAYWGFFGGVNVLMSRWVYELLNALAIIALIGVAGLLALWLVRGRAAPAVGPALAPAPAPMVLVVIWPLTVAVALERWAATTPASQGRLLFPAISCFSLWFAVGLSAWLPRRMGTVVLGALVGFLLALSAAAPFVWIAPAYAAPPQLDVARLPSDAVRTNIDFAAFDGRFRLVGYRLDDTQASPGDTVAVTLFWQVIAPPQRDLSVFVHVLDENDIVIAQRDTYPGLGSLATSRLAPGRAWADHTVILVRDTVYAPSAARLEIGLYDLTTGVRAQATGGRDSVRLGDVQILARPGPIPNPLSVNLEDKIDLVGYTLDRRAARPGETIRLTLYWRGRAPMDLNYTVFAHVLGDNNAIWGQKDSWPQDGDAPTSAWLPGELIEDPRDLVVKRNAPPGVYDIEVGVYLAETGDRLRVLTPDGRVVDNRVLLSKVRVYGP